MERKEEFKRNEERGQNDSENKMKENEETEQNDSENKMKENEETGQNDSENKMKENEETEQNGSENKMEVNEESKQNEEMKQIDSENQMKPNEEMNQNEEVKPNEELETPKTTAEESGKKVAIDIDELEYDDERKAEAFRNEFYEECQPVSDKTVEEVLKEIEMEKQKLVLDDLEDNENNLNRNEFQTQDAAGFEEEDDICFQPPGRDYHEDEVDEQMVQEAMNEECVNKEDEIGYKPLVVKTIKIKTFKKYFLRTITLPKGILLKVSREGNPYLMVYSKVGEYVDTEKIKEEIREATKEYLYRTADFHFDCKRLDASNLYCNKYGIYAIEEYTNVVDTYEDALHAIKAIYGKMDDKS